MRRRILRLRAAKDSCVGVGLLLVALATMVGCQGFSSSKPASQQTTQVGTILLSSASLDFGSVTAGTSKTLTLSASNTGAAAVSISSVSISTKYFTLSAPSLPVSIAPGQNSTISLVFTPNVAGAFSATVSISSNASDSSSTLSLSGTGVSNGQLVINPTGETFGNVTVGSQSSQTVTLTNNTGSAVNISQAAVSGSGFKLSGIATPLALNASANATFTITFAPATTGTSSGNVTITSDAVNPSLSMAVSGTGVTPGALGANPTSLDFGTVQVGSNLRLSDSVTNTGGSTLTISSVGISGTGFALSGISTPVTLAPAQSATFTVTFTPSSAASASGSVAVTSSGSNPTLSIPLAGTGTIVAGQLTATPATLPVGSVVVGTSGTASGSLNASVANVTVTAASTNNSRFTISGLSLPAVISAGKSVPFTVTFSPQVSGTDSATLTFTSNAQPSTATAAATGTGTAAPTHTVSLSWSASTSPSISGYNIYRAIYLGSCGSYSRMNGSTLITLTTYSDSSVTAGTNYCYATTAVNSSSEESGYSNIVSDVQIPPP
ncbi:MAG TPA: choice-of-anchor D domain-containing protein [Candidatus Acidoferrales bacterium]|nr:choice-of-anchor D domain-containing protein [Candidatus Acidoferrales bacterium]